MTLRSGDLFWSYYLSLVVLLSSMFDLEMLTLGYSPLISDRFCEMIVYTRHILSRDYLALRVYPFWEDVFILGQCHLVDFDIETRPSIHDCYFQWIIKLLSYGFSFLNILGLTWIPSFLGWTSRHPTFDTIIPTSILVEPNEYWACLFHHPTWPYLILFIRGGCKLVLSFLVEFSHAFGR